jgi:hypothetical protein
MITSLVLAGTMAAVFGAADPGADELDLGRMVQPVPGHARFVDEDWYIWCGSMVRAADGTCHLYYSRWPRGRGHQGWATSSEIAHAVASDPLGPYRFVDVALPARGKTYWDGLCTHNPNVLQIGGRFYLYYMGNTGDGRSFWMHRNNQRIGVAVAEGPQGPWRRLDHPILDVSTDRNAFDALCVTNPAAALRPDGGVLLIYKAVADNGTEKGGRVRYGAALADRPEGPFLKTSGRIFEPETPGRSDEAAWMLAEDPFVWFSARHGDQYYALARDVVGRFTGEAGGLVLFRSKEGLHWEPAAHPRALGPTFAWDDGTTSKTKLERPQLYLEDGVPRVLFGAVDVNSPHPRAHSLNVHIPLK